MTKNTQILDSNGEASDWIELYNNSNKLINLKGYHLSDDEDEIDKWTFPNININPNDHLLVYASGEDITDFISHWETIINHGDIWEYHYESDPPSNWNTNEFNGTWKTGPSGFGYADDDDNTIVPYGTTSIYIRKEININMDNVINIVLHVDYDDGFIAYINGLEVARENITDENEGTNTWNEAVMYKGGSPKLYNLDISKFINGNNIIAIRVNNYNNTSSDLSIIPFLSLGYNEIPNNPIGSPEILNLINGNLHTNFKLKSSEPVILSDQNNKIIDSFDPIDLPADISYGRYPDGSGDLYYFTNSTPGSTNNSSGYLGICNDPVLIDSTGNPLEGGIYQNIITLTISNTDNSSIYYTLDSSEPTDKDMLYSDPITISSTTILRIRSFKNNWFPSNIITNSYLFNISTSLPIMSLSTEPDNLFSNEEGIYVFGNNASSSDDYPYFNANFWEDWERPIHIEFYDDSKVLGFKFDGGVKIFGGWSRGLPQKSLSIFTRSQYGISELEYNLFPDKPLDIFEAFVLRNSGNDWFGLDYGGGMWSTNVMFRDALMTGLAQDTDLDLQYYRPCVVYLNGEYWGIHNIREKINEHFIASNNNINPDDINRLELNAEVIQGNNTEYNNLINFVQNNDMNISKNYNYVNEEVDINNFIDYYIFNIFFGNTDWPGNNIKFWNSPSTKWRWILYDTDFGFSLANPINSGYNYSHNTLSFALEENGSGWPNPPWSTLLFRKLMDNSTFKNKFINRFCYYLSTTFNSSNIDQKMDIIIKNINSEISSHCVKWGSNINTWNSNINTLNIFKLNRKGFMYQHIRNNFDLSERSTLTININIPDKNLVLIEDIQIMNSYNGEYYNDIPIRLEALNTTEYIFVNWSDGFSGTDNIIEINIKDNYNINANFIKKPVSIFINEILAKNTKGITDEKGEYEDWIELYNPNDDSIVLSNMYLTDTLEDLTQWQIPENISISPKSYYLFWCDNDEEQGNNHTNFKLSSNGEYVVLVDIDGKTIIDSVKYPELEDDTSYCRSPDGSDNWIISNKPTPLKLN